MMNRAELLDLLIRFFTTDDLRTLCFKLGVDYRSLKGRSLQAKARELIDVCERSGRIAELETAMQRQRPDAVPTKAGRTRRAPSAEVVGAAITGIFGVIIAFVTYVVPVLLPAADPTPTLAPTQIVAAPTSTAAMPTATQTPTQTPLPPATETPPIPTDAPFQPTASVLTNMSPQAKAAFTEAARAVLDVARQLPLFIDDEFENNDYGWPVLDKTNYGPVNCQFGIADGGYQIQIESIAGPGWCRVAAPRTARDFLATVHLSTLRTRNVRVQISYWYVDEQNFHRVTYNPDIQQFEVTIRHQGVDYPVVPLTYAEAIAKQGANEISILAQPETTWLYFNGSLVAGISGVTSREGSIWTSVYLDEAGAADTLSIERFELRGN